MTQPEKSVPVEPAAGAPSATPSQSADKTDQDKLSIESIGWLFIQKYYSTYTGDISKLFTFYDKEASVIHDEFPSGEAETASTKTINLASGIDAIKKHFAAQTQGAEKNKIVIERADFQKSVNDSILIVVCGSWKRGTSNLLQFVQTFVLTAKEKTVYDVSNDLLKFIDFSEQYRETKVLEVEASDLANGNGSIESAAEITAEDAPVEKPVSEAATPAEIPAQKLVSEPVSVEKPVEEKPAVEAKSSNPEKVEETETETEQKQVDTSEKTEELEKPQKPVSEKEANDAKVAKPVSSEEKALTPSQKPTWANLAAIEPKVPKGSTVSSPTAAKSAPAQAKKSTSPAQPTQPSVPTNGKFKKEEWYPIYIRNIEVEDEELRSALVKQFGDIKFFRRSNKAALCDFRNKEDQQKALEAKEIVVKNNVILLEPRVHKPFNGKPDFKKDKKQVKKNGIKKN